MGSEKKLELRHGILDVVSLQIRAAERVRMSHQFYHAKQPLSRMHVVYTRGLDVIGPVVDGGHRIYYDPIAWKASSAAAPLTT